MMTRLSAFGSRSTDEREQVGKKMEDLEKQRRAFCVLLAKLE